MTDKRPPFLHSQAVPFLFIILVHIAAFSNVAHTTMAQNSTTVAGATNATDRDALLAIKSMIKDDPEDFLNSWNESTHFCLWQGVTCSTPQQRVTVLDLSSRRLAGSLSPFIGNLSLLRMLVVENNSLSGEIPPEVGRLIRLQKLYLNNNSFVGNIPANLSNCSILEVLSLGYNNLVGRIPEGLGSLSMLNLLVLNTNNLQGGIPWFIANLTSLYVLSLADCQLGGSIPDVFHRLSNLRRIAFIGNNLVGSIPPSLYSLSLLECLYLDNNKLEGRLPTHLGSMHPRLQVLSLADNQFTGPLPSSVFSSSELVVLDVGRNNFSGKVVINSRKVCNLLFVSLSWNSFGSGEDDEMKFIDALSICGRLQWLDIGDNQMRGFLPESLGNLSTTLNFLSLASNSFSGGLPSRVGNLSGLTSLDLSRNKLNGTIPVSIGNLGNLRRLDLTRNYFSGNIPDSLGKLSLLIELHLGLNQLNGTMPSGLGNCKMLIGLTLDRNNLTGDIPKQLFKLSSLSITLNLGSNHLSGKIPPEVGNLKNLNKLVVAKNRLSGELPSSLGSCSSLLNLDLSSNFFQGSLPSSLGSLRALQKLDVSHNNFTGKIPSYLEIIPLENLNISYNSFEGEVTTKGVFANASAVSIVGNSQICGGIPELQLRKCSSNNPKRGNKLSLAVKIIIALASVLICVAMVSFFSCYRQKKEWGDDPSTNTSESLIKVSYEMLYKATEGFSKKNLIGEGSFSSVYRGYLYTNGVIVAVKVLNLHRQGGSKSFISECEALRNTRHRNLVKVITCCSGIDFQGNDFKAIVYEFMLNGCLDQWLHSRHRTQNFKNGLPRLNLLRRVCIALDVAYALDYLHHHNGKTIVHCDLKPSNILLDEEMVAHVGDFGLSRILSCEFQNRYHSCSTGVRGTIGYAAPEYGLGSKVSTSGDIYSYGILLLEMMTCKKPTDPMFQDGLSLHNYVSTSMGNHALEIVDPILLNNDNEKLVPMANEGGIEEAEYDRNKQTCLRLLLKIGVSCSVELPQHQRVIASVIQELQLIKDAILGNSSIL